MMKISVKGLTKAVLGGATIVGGAILALQGKKALTQGEYPPTLEPIGGTDNEVETTETTQAAAPAETETEEKTEA